MEPKEIFAEAVGGPQGLVTVNPRNDSSKPESPVQHPGLQPHPRPAFQPGSDQSKLDQLGAAFDRLAVLEPDLLELLGRTWLAFLAAPWRAYEGRGDPQPFVAAVDRLGRFVRAVARAEWMRATLAANHDPASPGIAAGLEPGALVDRDFRRRWEAAVEQAWAFYVANLGILKSEIPPDLA